MPESFELLSQTRFTNSTSATVFTASSDEGTIIRHMRVTNNVPGNTVQFSMWHGSEVDADAILPASVIDNGGWAEFEGTIIVDNGQTIIAKCDPGSAPGTIDVTLSIYGLRMTSV
jgi:hypothetical protein